MVAQNARHIEEIGSLIQWYHRTVRTQIRYYSREL
jgi:hypothetical protein